MTSSWHSYKILAHKERIEQIRQGLMPIPYMAVYQLAYACNQNCKSCAFAKWNKGFIPKKEDIFRITDELITYGIRAFEFSGAGEPTTMPYLYELLKYIVDKGCDFSLITNGVDLSDELIKLVAERATYCRVSLETGDKELYCFYKGVDEWHFDKAVENIRQLIELKHPDTEISVKFDVGGVLRSEKHIERSFRLATGLGVDLAVFKAFTGDSELSETEKIELEYSLNKRIKDNTGKTKIINSIYYDKTVPQCWLNSLHTVIDGYGDVYICCYYYRTDRENHRLGNLLDKSFKEIWESPDHKERIKKIDSRECAKFDCKFFGHHKIADEALKKGRLIIL